MHRLFGGVQRRPIGVRRPAGASGGAGLRVMRSLLLHRGCDRLRRVERTEWSVCSIGDGAVSKCAGPLGESGATELSRQRGRSGAPRHSSPRTAVS